jgi:hypothetical protein
MGAQPQTTILVFFQKMSRMMTCGCAGAVVTDACIVMYSALMLSSLTQDAVVTETVFADSVSLTQSSPSGQQHEHIWSADVILPGWKGVLKWC